MLRAITLATLSFFLSGVAYAEGRDPAMGAVAPRIATTVGTAIGAKVVEKPIGTNNAIENPGSKDHTKHIVDLKSKGQYKKEGNATAK